MRTLRTLLAPIAAAAALMACSGGSSSPTAIEIDIDSLTLFASSCSPMVQGDTCQLRVEAYTAEGQRIGNPVLRWISFNASVASVSGEGLVTAKSPGEVTIEVSNTTSTVFARATLHVLRFIPK